MEERYFASMTNGHGRMLFCLHGRMLFCLHEQYSWKNAILPPKMHCFSCISIVTTPLGGLTLVFAQHYLWWLQVPLNN